MELPQLGLRPHWGSSRSSPRNKRPVWLHHDNWIMPLCQVSLQDGSVYWVVERYERLTKSSLYHGMVWNKYKKAIKYACTVQFLSEMTPSSSNHANWGICMHVWMCLYLCMYVQSNQHSNISEQYSIYGDIGGFMSALPSGRSKQTWRWQGSPSQESIHYCHYWDPPSRQAYLTIAQLRGYSITWYCAAMQGD